MDDFIWWVGMLTLLYQSVRLSAWVMRKLIFARGPKEFKHWLDEKNES